MFVQLCLLFFYFLHWLFLSLPSSAFNYHYACFAFRSSSARIEKLYQATIVVVVFVVIISFCTFVAWELFAVVLFFFRFIALAFAVGFYALKLSPRLTPETLLYVVIIIVIATVVAGQQKKQLSNCRRAKTRYSSGNKSCRGGKYLVTT